MEHLKSAVYLQAYGQKDPVIEYKREARKHFDGIYNEIKEKIKRAITSLDTKYILESMSVKSRIEKQAEIAIANSGKSEDSEKSQNKTIRKNKGENVGRNEPCSCGSGKKFKKCCGQKK
jgi:preprotein translocase subunit SecA